LAELTKALGEIHAGEFDYLLFFDVVPPLEFEEITV
jgi:hypothetical protein